MNGSSYLKIWLILFLVTMIVHLSGITKQLDNFALVIVSIMAQVVYLIGMFNLQYKYTKELKILIHASSISCIFVFVAVLSAILATELSAPIAIFSWFWTVIEPLSKKQAEA